MSIHISIISQMTVAVTREVLKNLLYSPDLAINGCHPFRPLKLALGIHLCTSEETQYVMQNWLCKNCFHDDGELLYCVLRKKVTMLRVMWITCTLKQSKCYWFGTLCIFVVERIARTEMLHFAIIVQ